MIVDKFFFWCIFACCLRFSALFSILANVRLEPVVIGKMVEDWRYQARVDDTVYGFLVALYACMIIVGATGNLLVIFVVIRNRAMRTARNVFIVNLAISDLMLCLITMPLTLVEILYMTWQVSTL